MSKSTCVLCQGQDLIAIYPPKAIVRCQDCGLRFVGSFPQTAKTLYQDQYYDSFAGREADLEKMWVKRLQLVKSFIARGKLLDVGAGTGLFVQLANKFFQAQGQEISEYSAQQAKKRYNVQIIPKPLEQLKGQFDAISAWHVFEHFPDPKLYASKMYGLLKEGGLLFAAIPNDNSWKQRVKRLINYKTLYADAYPSRENHLYFFTAQTFQALLESSGFEIINLKADDYYGQRSLMNSLKFLLAKLFTETLPLQAASALVFVARKVNNGHRD